VALIGSCPKTMAFHWPINGYNKPFHWLDINSFMPEHDLHFIILWNSKNLGSLCDHGEKRKLNTGTNNERLKGTLFPGLQMTQKKHRLKNHFTGKPFSSNYA